MVSEIIQDMSTYTHCVLFKYRYKESPSTKQVPLLLTQLVDIVILMLSYICYVALQYIQRQHGTLSLETQQDKQFTVPRVQCSEVSGVTRSTLE